MVLSEDEVFGQFLGKGVADCEGVGSTARVVSG